MRSFLLACAFFLLITSGYAQGGNSGQIRSLVREGIQLFDHGDLEAAKLKYEEALKLDKKNPYALFELAFTYETLGQYDEAISLSKKTLKRKDLSDEVRSNFYVLYGNSLDKNGQLKKAIKIYRKGLAKYPDFHLLHFNLGVTYLGDKKFTKAKDHFQLTVKANPSHASGHYYLALTSESLDQRIPTLLAGMRYLSLEALGHRADIVRALLPNLLIKKTEVTEDGISIPISDDLFASEKTEDDFFAVALILDLANAKENAGNETVMVDSPTFARSFSLLCNLMEKHEEQAGFFWEYYAPFFAQLSEKEYTNTFVKLIADPSKQKNKEWKTLHSGPIRSYRLWSEDYTWPK